MGRGAGGGANNALEVKRCIITGRAIPYSHGNESRERLIMEQNGIEGHDFFTVVRVGYIVQAGRVYAFIWLIGGWGG